MSHEKTAAGKSRKRSASLTQRLKEMRSSAGSSRSRGDSPHVSDSESEEQHNKVPRSTNSNDKEVQLHELQERVRVLEAQSALQQLHQLEAPITGVNAGYALVSDDGQASLTAVEKSWVRRCCFYCCWT